MQWWMGILLIWIYSHGHLVAPTECRNLPRMINFASRWHCFPVLNGYAPQIAVEFGAKRYTPLSVHRSLSWKSMCCVAQHHRDEGLKHQNHPVIVVRKRKAKHGGWSSWWVMKNSYADFMTAMMAFFLVWVAIGFSPQQLTSVPGIFFTLKIALISGDKSSSVSSPVQGAVMTNSSKWVRCASTSVRKKAAESIDLMIAERWIN